MVRTYTCKVVGCGHTAEGNGPSVLIAHARDKHGAQRGAARKKKDVVVEPEPHDDELELLGKCVDAFCSAQTDRAQDFRVLEYLAQRFGPMAYDDGETDAG